MEFTVAFLFCQSQNKFHFTVTQKMHNYMLYLNKYYFFLFVLQILTQNLYCQNLQVVFFFKIHIKNNNKDEEKTKMFNIDEQKKNISTIQQFFFFLRKTFFIRNLNSFSISQILFIQVGKHVMFFWVFCYTMYINSYAARILLPLTHQPTKYRYTPAYN